LIVGGRGTGKTVLLHHIADHARDEWRWITLNWQGRADWSFQQLIDDERPRIEHDLAGRARRAARAVRPDSVTAAVPGVGSATRNLEPHQRSGQSITAQLRGLASLAKQRDRSLLLVVDELQAASAGDLAALSGSLQLLANGEHLPIAMVAAGLSNSKAVIRAVPGTTFIERQDELHLGNLDPTSTAEAVLRPIEAAGRTISRPAIEHLVAITAGYPYAIQLAGRQTWDAAGDGSEITLHHARIGAQQALVALAANVYQARWDDLSDVERRYLQAAADLSKFNDEARTGDIAQRLDRTQQQLSTVRASLIDKRHILRASRHGLIAFDIPGFADWIRTATDVDLR
jgi:hypothetical protein